MAAALLPAGLAFLMFVVGMRLTLGGIADAFRRPAALLGGLAVQVVVLPLLAVALGRAFALEPAMAAGLLLIAAAPGGITSNYIALLAQADVALSTAMTLVTSLMASLTIPLVLLAAGIDLGAGSPFSAMARMSLVMFAVAAVPLLLGLAVRRFLPGLARHLERPLDIASRAVFAAIVLSTFWQNREAMIEHLSDIGPAVALLNLGAIAAGFGIAGLIGLGRPQGFAIAVETGLQNAAMAMFVATAVFAQPALTVPALVYAVLMNVTALALIAMSRRLVARPA